MRHCEGLTVSLFLVYVGLCKTYGKYMIGGLFPEGYMHNQTMISYKRALIQHNVRSNSTLHKYQIAALSDRGDLSDSFVVSGLICKCFNTCKYIKNTGPLCFAAVVHSNTVQTMASYSTAFAVPFITPSFAKTEALNKDNLDFMVSVRPPLIDALIDLMKFKKWNAFAYFYGHDEALFRLQALIERLSLKDFNVAFRRIGDRNEIEAALRELMRLKIYNIVIDADVPITQSTMEIVDVVGVNTALYTFVLLQLDSQTIDKESMKYRGATTLAFRLSFQTTDIIYKGLEEKWEKHRKLHPDAFKNQGTLLATAILTYDMVDTIVEALRLAEEKNVSLIAPPQNCQEKVAWSRGPLMLEYMKKVDIQGLSGRIAFNAIGDRTNYTLDVLRLRGTGLVKIGVWNSSLTEAERQKVFSTPDNNETLQNRTFTVTSILEKPFLIKKVGTTPADGNEQYEGYCKDLLDELSKHLKFKYKLQLVKDGEYGTYDETLGRWNGMIGEIKDGTADMAVASLTINAQRERDVLFTKPFMTLGISIMVKKPLDPSPDPFSFLRPLSTEIWLCIIFAYTGVSVVLFLVSRFSPTEWYTVREDGDVSPTPVEDSSTEEDEPKTNDFGIFNSLWFSMGAFMQQGCEISPRSLSGRIVGGVWWFFTLIIISSYTANLAAFLTVERMDSPIESAEDLAKQTDITYGTLASGASFEFFKNSKIHVYERMWNFMQSTDPPPFVKTNQQGVNRVRQSDGKYAFLLESTVNEYHNQQLPCDTLKVGSNLDSKGYGIAVSPNLPKLREQLTLALLELRDWNNTLQHLQKKWWYFKGNCDPTDSNSQGTASALTLSSVAGVFYILICGLALAIIVAILEFCMRSRKHMRQTRKPSKSTSYPTISKASMALRDDDPANHPMLQTREQMLKLHGMETRCSNRRLGQTEV
ncbi:glutamate receptor 2-like [Anneissia japonica]|uniref:glutamate receptor 2-like n=1 Tax=Anneissia japonica TaxID=1529436 RepID=UPI001425B16C|nr:glutamate receptor 2-like [Anneissia japonica]